MFGGGSSKVGRGGGRGGGGGGQKRFSAPPQPPRSSIPSTGHISLSGGTRNRNPAPAAAAPPPPPAVEESFNLVSGHNPLAFAMIIRLAPDLVEEIRRLEALGETAKIKFDANPKNPSGNLINVGGKEFRFTWSKECGDLCDIYEEKRSGEDGNGLLVESGCAWRKLTVQRILDESTTNHVKMLSEEAERKNKARKAIVLDHGNPSMKSQIKQLAAVEATSTWRVGLKKKEPPPKKRRVDPPNVSSGGSKKSAYKSGLPSNSRPAGRGGHSISPLASSPDHFRASASPSGAANVSKNNITNEDTTISESEVPIRPSGMAPDRLGPKVNLGSNPSDLQSMLISLLRDNPKGMSVKALEKALGCPISNSGKAILNKIATYQTPGRYFLKPGVEFEGFKGRSPGTGSPSQDDHNRMPMLEENFDQTPLPEPAFPKEVLPNNGLAEVDPAVQGELDTSGNVDIELNSPDLSGDKKDSDNSDRLADSSSDSESDSDSDSDSRSSDSGSPSRSRSRSRSKSPVGSGSGSSSDSDSDASSNQEGSDEEVDIIMTSDDDKGPKHNIQETGPGFPSSPPEGGFLDIDGVDEKHDGHESDIVDIDNGYRATAGDTNCISPNHDERQNFIGSLFDEDAIACEDNFKQEQSDSSERASKGQTRRGYNSNHSDVKTEQAKKLKKENYGQPVLTQGCDGHYSLSPRDTSPERCNEDLYQSPAGRMLNRVDREVDAELSIRKGRQMLAGKPSLHSQRLSSRVTEQGNYGSTTYDVSGRPRQAEGMSHVQTPFQKERPVREAQYESYGTARKGPRNSREGSTGSKRSLPSDSPYDKFVGTEANNLKEVGQLSGMQMGSSRKDIDRAGIEKLTVINGRGGSMMQRDIMGLELGELCPEEASVKRPFERKGSFKQHENQSNYSENRSIDLSNGKTPGKSNVDLGKPSPPNLSRKRTVERGEDDLTVPILQGIQSQSPHPSRGDHGDGSAQMSKKVNVSNSTRNGTQLDVKQGSVSQTVKESKARAGGTNKNMLNGQQKETVSADCVGGAKRRESSSDENSCSYSKYEKDEPELRGRIKDYAQYKEYVQEYCDKFESYSSINKILEEDRNAFQKMGKELEFAKGRDSERYNHILEQLRSSYRLCGSKHKRLKKIFVVLHAELKHLKLMIIEFAQSYSKD